MTAANARRRRGPGSRADHAHPTRHQILAAAAELLTDGDDAALSVSRVTERAGVAKGTFYVHFENHDEFLLDLHERFHARAFAEIRASAAGRDPGAERLRERLEAFLDACLKSPAARALLLHARPGDALRERNAERWAEAAAAVASDLAAVSPGRPCVSERARLIVAATAEAARAELEASRRLPRMRAALLAFAECDEDRV